MRGQGWDDGHGFVRRHCGVKERAVLGNDGEGGQADDTELGDGAGGDRGQEPDGAEEEACHVLHRELAQAQLAAAGTASLPGVAPRGSVCSIGMSPPPPVHCLDEHEDSAERVAAFVAIQGKVHMQPRVGLDVVDGRWLREGRRAWLGAQQPGTPGWLRRIGRATRWPCKPAEHVRRLATIPDRDGRGHARALELGGGVRDGGGQRQPL